MTLTLTFTLTLQAVVMTYSLAKVQGQQSVGSKNRVEKMDEQTDRGNCITSLANALNKQSKLMLI